MEEHSYLLLKEEVIQLFYGGRLCRLLVLGFVILILFYFLHWMKIENIVAFELLLNNK